MVPQIIPAVLAFLGIVLMVGANDYSPDLKRSLQSRMPILRMFVRHNAYQFSAPRVITGAALLVLAILLAVLNLHGYN